MIRTETCTVVLTVIICLGAGDSSAVDGRIQASNLMLYQVGHDPGSQETDGTRLFDRLQLDYLSGDFRYGLRAQTYRTSELGLVHEAFDNKYAEWRGRDIRVRIGSSYTTIGRGLLFRAFELPGVVREVNTITDSKYMDSRDLDGVVVEGRSGRLEFLLMSGRPLAYADNPPGLDFLARRDGTVSGGRVGFDLGRGLSLGHGYIRSDGFIGEGRIDTEEFASVDVTIDGASFFPAMLEAGWDARLYTEYAGLSWTPISDSPSTSADNPHALYTSVEVSRERWTVTWETKHYRDFQLPFNDAPNLVPELAPSLVNRRSHFLFADDEKGHLLGLQGAFAGDWTIHIEHAGANNSDEMSPLEYSLSYVEIASPPLEDTRVTLFAAEGRDDIESLSQHRTLGITIEQSVSDRDAIAVELGVQTVERTGSDIIHHDILATVSVSRAGLGSLSLVLEKSDDPEMTDDPFTLDIETERRTWLGVIGQASLNRYHELFVFAGKRRGGTACTSGTCYLVPDFSGVEARVVSRF
jgi:hypothetical protein